MFLQVYYINWCFKIQFSKIKIKSGKSSIFWKRRFLALSSVHQNSLFDRLACPFVCLSVRSHDNSWTCHRRMMKLGTIILEVKSNIEFEDGSRTWPFTRSNWGCVLVSTCICIYVLLQFIEIEELLIVQWIHQ